MRTRNPKNSLSAPPTTSKITSLSADIVLNALSKVIDPELGRDLVTLGMIKDLQVKEGLVRFTLRLTTPACPLRDELQSMAKNAVATIPGVKDVQVKLDAQVPPGIGLPDKRSIPGVQQVIAVASGKGGVGKSTIAVNLACALSELGGRVGLLDGDFYGPNVPQMLGSQGRPFAEANRIIPIESHGIQVMSFDYLIEPNKPVIWRGPLLMEAIQQLLFDTAWKALDYLIVDLPPGTGDVPLSLIQLVLLAGVVVVTTPQSIALSDVTRCIEMFRATNTPILGIVENMSYLVCPDCGRQMNIFGKGGGQWLADKYGIPLLVKVPFDAEICEGGDNGHPAVNVSECAASNFNELAEKVAAQVSIRQLAALPNR